MQRRTVGMCLGLLSVAMLAFAATASAQDKGDKSQKKKQTPAEKVEMKDVPEKVLAAAKKEAPNVNFASVEKVTAGKKVGTVYSLEGKDGKYQVTVQVDSSGELRRYTKALERKRKKATK